MVNSFSKKSSRSESQYPEFAPSGRSGAPAMHSLGAMLRERREAMGVTLAEVEVATRIRQKYLSALEADEWHLLPGEVVGRGFLRNYADYLGLEPNEVMERRRAVTDSNLNQALSTTSAGAPLPPERDVDYRPKEVDLKDETDDVEQGEIRLTPILAIVALAALIALGWWGIGALGAPIADLLAGSQTRVAGLFDRSPADADQPAAQGDEVAGGLGVVNEQNTTAEPPAAGGAAVTQMPGGVTNTLPAVVTPGTIVLGGAGTEGNGAAPPAAEQPGSEAPPPAGSEAATGEQPAGQPAALLVPTNTPEAAPVAPAEPISQTEPITQTAAPELPTATPEPPTPEPPTPTPEALPTETPTPEPPPAPVAAAPCADGRAVIAGPGAGQAVSGVVGVTGTAQHESFQYYKLEYAPGAWAAGGYVYFDGSNSQVIGGLLGNLDSSVLPNGDYTIRLTVVDQTGNFPPPCDVAIVVQN
ncbi:MAG: hypothetical protein DCC57_18325 [Chloroflexi bacterium]|nr:MAG: hypothetical protein DCC57_18325 [Chloroflexota bacterium]